MIAKANTTNKKGLYFKNPGLILLLRSANTPVANCEVSVGKHKFFDIVKASDEYGAL